MTIVSIAPAAIAVVNAITNGDSVSKKTYPASEDRPQTTAIVVHIPKT